jgi:hypothetical protein
MFQVIGYFLRVSAKPFPVFLVKGWLDEFKKSNHHVPTLSLERPILSRVARFISGYNILKRGKNTK